MADNLLIQAKTLLKQANLHPKRSLGQNFMINEAVLDQIVAAADLKPADTVVEIGAGLGFLTEKIVPFVGELRAYEIDPNLVKILTKRFKSRENVKIKTTSALEYRPPVTAYKIVANIPYYLTSFFLKRHLQEVTNKPTLMILLVQKEVAEEITAVPGQMSLLAVSVQSFAEARIIADVERDNFYPSPRVDSAIIRIELRPDVFEDDYWKDYFRIVKAGFHNKRKQLKNNLKTIVTDSGRVLSWLKQAEIDPARRAQTLSLREWHTLTRLYQTHGY